jgi:hypothetical protein
MHAHDDCLHCAWQRAEAAMPADAEMVIEQIRAQPNDRWHVTAVLADGRPSRFPHANRPTPAEALNALATLLEQEESDDA